MGDKPAEEPIVRSRGVRTRPSVRERDREPKKRESGPFLGFRSRSDSSMPMSSGGAADPPADPGPPACSICLEPVAYSGARSTARLHCGHEFHLDCIGSAFNAKGAMQCPNCREVENGNWLYAKGGQSFPELNFDEWMHDEDFYEISSDMQVRFHLCPYTRSAEGYLPFEEFEAVSAANPYEDAIFAEHAITAAANSHPYMYLRIFQPSFSDSDRGRFDGGAYEQFRRHVLGPTRVQTARALYGQQGPLDGRRYHPFPQVPPSRRTGDPDEASLSSSTLRATRFNSDGLVPQARPLYQQIGNGIGSSDSSMVAPDLATTRPEAQPYEHYQNPASLGMHDSVFSDLQQSGSSRGLAPIGPTPPSALQHAGYYLFPHSDSFHPIPQDFGNSGANQLYAWEREHFAPFPLMNVDRGAAPHGSLPQQVSGASSSNTRRSFAHRHDTEMSSLQGRSVGSSYGPYLGPRMHHFI